MRAADGFFVLRTMLWATGKEKLMENRVVMIMNDDDVLLCAPPASVWAAPAPPSSAA